jgi:SSS family transporter
MSSVLVWIAIYVAAQIALGYLISRGVRSTADFVVAGRSLGPVLVSTAIFATFFGAEAIVGTAGSVYERGLAGAQADPIGYTFAILIVGLLFAGRLRAGGYLTFADFFRERYSPLVERIVVLVLLPGSLFWAAAQLRAFGQVVDSAAGLGLVAAIAIGALVVVAYSALGGVLADAWSDLFQSIIILLGLSVLLAAVVTNAGGWSSMTAGIPAERINLLSIEDGGMIGLFERLAVPVFGTIVAVEIVSLLLASRSPDAARAGCMVGALLYLAIAWIPVTIGLVGPSLLPSLDEAETVVPRLAEQLLSAPLYVLFIGAVISAIVSTVATIFLASSSQVIQNLVRPLRPTLTDQQRLTATRLALIAFGATAFALAATSENVKSLVETASAAGSSGVVVATVLGLFTPLGGPIAALASIIVGSGSWAILSYAELVETPFITATLLALATYLAAAMLETRGRTAT